MKIELDTDTANGRDCETLRHLIDVIREREMRDTWNTLYPDRDRRFFCNEKDPDEIVRIDRTSPRWDRLHKLDLGVREKAWEPFFMPDGTDLIFEDWGSIKRGWVEITDDKARCADLMGRPVKKS